MTKRKLDDEKKTFGKHLEKDFFVLFFFSFSFFVFEELKDIMAISVTVFPLISARGAYKIAK